MSKPDLEIVNSGHHFVSAKKGTNQLSSAFRTAADYSIELPHAVELRNAKIGEFFAVTYPRRPGERFHLMMLGRAGRHKSMSFAPMRTVDEVAEAIFDVVEGKYDEFSKKLEPTGKAAQRMLYYGAEALAETIGNVPDRDLEQIFGGADFFKSVLQARLKGSERRKALRMGPAFLFVNQIFFYILLAQADSEASRDQFPSIQDKDKGSPKRLQDYYFMRVRQKDYYPIYGIDVARFFKGNLARTSCYDVVDALSNLAPSLELPDLVGQVFQTLIPIEIRKPLGANYTNPNAAELLARMAVQKPNTTVLDPACGSGTLLVSAYNRKRELSGPIDPKEMHKAFLEHDITGIDVMAFSAHLAAVNLALQQPLEDTDRVRIGTTDSSILKPGDLVASTAKFLPTALRQTTLLDSRETDQKKPSRGGVSLRSGSADEFTVDFVDLVIMNPPFTSWENMDEAYRNPLRMHYENLSAEHRNTLRLRPSQQLFFLLLADRFLNKDGTVAAILPLTTFTGKSYHNFVRWFAARYKISHIFLGLGRASFSEDTALTECMVVARKGKPPANHSIVVVGTLKRPEHWTREDILQISAVAFSRQVGVSSSAKTRLYAQSELTPDRESLGGFFLRLDDAFDEARLAWDSALSSGSLKVCSFRDIEKSTGIVLAGGIRTGEHLSYYGNKAMIICRNAERAARESDRLIFKEIIDSRFVLEDKITHQTFEYPRNGIGAAVRRFSYLPRIDVTSISDFCISRINPELSRIMRTYYAAQEADKYMRRINEVSKQRREGRWVSRLKDSSSRLLIVRRIDLGSPGTTVLATWSTAPALVACEGYVVQGLDDPQKEKLLALWYNSTLFILLVLGHATITRGTWIKFEEFSLQYTPVPDIRSLSPEQRTMIDELWAIANASEWPSLMSQLESNWRTRETIDKRLLEIMGVKDETKRDELTTKARKGALSVLTGLLKTMGVGGEVDESDED